MKKHAFACAAISLLALTAPAIGADNWQPIERAKSLVSFTGDDSFVKSRDWQRRDNGVQERIKLDVGQIFYEELYYSGGQWVGIDRKRYLRDMLAGGLNKNEQKFQPSEILKRDFSKFGFDYLTAQSSDVKCLLGVAAEERDGRTWHMNVVGCRALNSKNIAKFEDDIFDVLARIRFDGGELNRTKTDIPPQASVPKPNPPAASAPAQSQPATAGKAMTPRAVIIKWDSYPKPIETTVEMRDTATTGDFKLTLPKDNATCDGRFQASNANKGSWSVACANGVGATGTYQATGLPGSSVVARGKDLKGQNVEITVAAVQPSGPPPVYPKLGPVSAILDAEVIRDGLKSLVKDYQAKKQAKVLVMSENGHDLYWSNRPSGLEALAIDSAMNNCQTKTKQSCYVIALNDDLAVNLDAIRNRNFK